jgi:predicted porin
VTRRIALVHVAATGGMLLSAAASAQTYENDTGGSVRFYGQFSPTWLSFNDGQETTDTLADNANSNTRLGFALKQPFGDNTLTLTFETSLGLVQTSEISNGDIPKWIDWQRTDLRLFEAAWSANFGTVTFGQGPMVTDKIAELDASGTAIAGYSAVSDVAGGFFFRGDDGILSEV